MTTSASTWLRRGTLAMTAALVAGSLTLLHLDGRLPAPVPSDAPPYTLADLSTALEAVSHTGDVNLAQLKQRHAAIERHVAALAATAPATSPEQFPTADARVAYWLNTFHALVLFELLDARGPSTHSLGGALRSWNIGGQRLNKPALVRRFLEASEDARVLFALFTGAKGRGVLDGAPFDGATLDAQLDDAMRRFVRRPENAHLAREGLELSAMFELHAQALLAALPPERQSVLQIVWAYLPDSCEGLRPGCLTRTDLDRACGTHFDRCTVRYLPIDESLAVVW